MAKAGLLERLKAQKAQEEAAKKAAANTGTPTSAPSAPSEAAQPTPQVRHEETSSDQSKESAGAEGAVGVLPPDASPRDFIPPPAEAAPAFAPKKRGRPKKAAETTPPAETKIDSFDSMEGATFSEPATAADTASADLDAPFPPAPPAEHKSIVIYIDCYPVKGKEGDPALLEEWLGPIMRDVAAEHGVADYRQIQYTSKAELAIGIRRVIETAPSVILASSYGNGTDVALEILIPYAMKVVKGLRG